MSTLPKAPSASLPEIQQALAGRESGGFWPHADGVLQVMTVPITMLTVTAGNHGDTHRRLPPRQQPRRAVQAGDRERHRVRRRGADSGIDAASRRSRAAGVAPEDRRRADDLARERRVCRLEASVGAARPPAAARMRRACCCFARAPSGCDSSTPSMPALASSP